MTEATPNVGPSEDRAGARTEAWLEHVRTFHWSPNDISRELGRRVISQEPACRLMATLIRQHIRRLQLAIDSGTWTQSASMVRELRPVLLIGPPAVGKTLLASSAARLAGLGWVREDCSTLTAVGWEGRSINNILETLLVRCDMNYSVAKYGIVLLDEVDKIRKRASSTSLDVGGEGAQRSLLGLLDGGVAQIEYPPNAPRSSRTWTSFYTSDLLIILAGAFEGLHEVVSRRLGVRRRRMGFGGGADCEEDMTRNELLIQTTPEDLVDYGMMPELVSRLGQVIVMNELGREDLRRVLLEAKDGPLSAQQRLAEREGFCLELTDALVDGIVEEAEARGLGARSLHSVLSRVLQVVHFEMPVKVNPFATGVYTVRLDTPALHDGSYELHYTEKRRSRKKTSSQSSAT